MDCMRDDFREGAVLGGRFKTISPLNQGSFGMVFKARDLDTGKPVAIKCLTKDNDPSCPATVAVDDRSEELPIHKLAGRHPNIVNFITAFETRTHSYLVLEYCPNGDLYEAIRANKGPLETEHVRDFMLQLVNAVDCLHSKGIYHRDIKPENIFLTSSGSMKLGDFGLATMETWSVEYGVGSDRYMAPEQFEAIGVNGYSPPATDIWAIGICLLNILFGRNPFATPTPSDPLFRDFLRDQQSLFDVFPNMSQDTFSVLTHCLNMDPTRRSLAAVRDALNTVVSFTTDDESLDDFCIGDATIATHNREREPLRTPSITSPHLDNAGSFPWAKALQATPQHQPRRLSVIHDSDEMFPDGQYKRDADATSLSSALDSGIGMSYKSSNISSGAVNVPRPMSSSVPNVSSRAMASIYGKESELFSKSWSELWEEDEEEELQRSSFESPSKTSQCTTEVAKTTVDDSTRCSTPAIDIVSSSRGSSTPRVSMAESRTTSPTSFRSRLSSHLKQMAISAPIGTDASKRAGSSADKWAALGNVRRGDHMRSAAAAVKQTERSADRSTFSPFASSQKSKPRDRSGSWRKDQSPVKQPFHHELWNLSKDWRSPKQSNYTTAPSYESPIKTRPIPLRRKSPWRSTAPSEQVTDDIGDLEWVGGWNDLQL